MPTSLLLLAASVFLVTFIRGSKSWEGLWYKYTWIMAAKMCPQSPFFGFRDESEGRKGDLETKLRSTSKPRQLNLIEGPWVFSLKIYQWFFYFTPLKHKNRLYYLPELRNKVSRKGEKDRKTLKIFYGSIIIAALDSINLWLIVYYLLLLVFIFFHCQ